MCGSRLAKPSATITCMRASAPWLTPSTLISTTHPLTSALWKSMRHPYYAKSNSFVHKGNTGLTVVWLEGSLVKTNTIEGQYTDVAGMQWLQDQDALFYIAYHGTHP